MSQTLLSVVIPVHNEEENLVELHARLSETAARMIDDAELEFVFVDDGSTDGSLSVLRELAADDSRVVIVELTRNWGSHPALKAGLRECRGHCCAAISADLQDPPEMLPEFLSAYRKGFEVVWGVRASRRDPLLKRLWANGFYTLFRRLALPNLPKGGVDTFLISRRVRDELLAMKERNNLPYYQILWLGHPYAVVPYHRAARKAGVSKWSFRKRLRSAFDALLAFTPAPIRWLSATGAALLAVGCIWSACWVVASLQGSPWAGPGLAPLMCLLSSLNLIGMGILGEYLWRVAADVKQRPEVGVRGVERGEDECRDITPMEIYTAMLAR